MKSIPAIVGLVLGWVAAVACANLIASPSAANSLSVSLSETSFAGGSGGGTVVGAGISRGSYSGTLALFGTDTAVLG